MKQKLAHDVTKDDLKKAKENPGLQVLPFDLRKTLPLPKILTNIFYKRALCIYCCVDHFGSSDRAFVTFGLMESVGVFYSINVDLKGGQGKGSAGQVGNNAPFRATLAPVCMRVKTSVSTCLVLATDSKSPEHNCTVVMEDIPYFPDNESPEHNYIVVIEGAPSPLTQSALMLTLPLEMREAESRGSVSAFVWWEGGKPLRKNQPGYTRPRSNTDLPVISNEVNCESDTLDYVTTEEGHVTLAIADDGRDRGSNPGRVPKNVLRPGRSMNRRGKRGLIPILLPPNQEEPVDKHITPLYLLLPLLLVIPAWMPIMSLYIFLECCLHAWSHRKSRKFNTPLGYLMENYCSTCLTERSSQKIIKMQDERKIRAINRKLAYCAYVKKMSVVS
uniref:Uncharacterized protein n=1 Tax=Timema genevievae TaxID=629358 RepID=A0A7R9JYE9_TIMGE|nr:unnamed protein product [Timema genevievae]